MHARVQQRGYRKHEIVMRAVVYCRVSTKEQTQNLSLDTQQRACEEYCNRNGYEVARVFIEEGESAKTANRTAFRKLLEFCRQNKNSLHAVVVYAINRFAHSTHDHAVVTAHLRKLGITLRTGSEPLADPSTGRLWSTSSPRSRSSITTCAPSGRSRVCVPPLRAVAGPSSRRSDSNGCLMKAAGRGWFMIPIKAPLSGGRSRCLPPALIRRLKCSGCSPTSAYSRAGASSYRRRRFQKWPRATLGG